MQPLGQLSETIIDQGKATSLKRAWELVHGNESIPDDFELAETLAKKSLAKDEADPEAMIVMGNADGNLGR